MGVFLSTFEKQLDAKRRIVVPQEFRAALATPFDGIFVFPSMDADCVEGGGRDLYEKYSAMADELDLGDPIRTALDTTVFAGMQQLTFDTAGRIVMPEQLCEQFGLSDWVCIVGLRDRFQIWEREAFKAHRDAQRELIKRELPALRAQQRAARLGVGA